MMYLLYGNRNKIKISAEGLEYLLKNSDLTYADRDQDDALTYLLLYNRNLPLFNREYPRPFSKGQIDYLIEHCKDRKEIFYALSRVCPIVLAATNHSHENNDFMIIKMIEKRLKTDPGHFNEKYFRKIEDQDAADKIKELLEILTVGKEIGEGVTKNENKNALKNSTSKKNKI